MNAKRLGVRQSSGALESSLAMGTKGFWPKTFENSPAIYGWVKRRIIITSPVRDGRSLSSLTGLLRLDVPNPELKLWAIFEGKPGLWEKRWRAPAVQDAGAND
jgi:hypothetical protein